MAINFPSGPTNGQVFINGKVKYVWYTANGYWQALPLATALPFNYIVNPTFEQSQQNLDTGGTTTGYYLADQWFMAHSGWTVTGQRATTAIPTNMNSRYSLFAVNQLAKASLAAGEYMLFQHTLEGQRVLPFMWGSVNGRQLVLRFWVMAPAGTWAVAVRNGINDRSRVFTYVISAGQAGNWVEQVIVIPPDTAGTWVTTIAPGMNIVFSWGVGTTYQTPVGAWAIGNFIGTSTGTNGAAVLSNQFRIADVGLYMDPALTGRAPPWEAPHIHLVDADCHRYFNTADHKVGTISAATNSNVCNSAAMVQMRNGPAQAIVTGATLYDGTVNNAALTVQSAVSSPRGSQINLTGTGLTIGRAAIMLGNTGSITQNARP